MGAWNTAVSFVTNTNWQWYSGESTLGYFAQMAGLAVQNFLSAAVGLAVAVALIRGFTREHTDRVGNFWVDLTRLVVRILLPLSIVAAVVLMIGGVVQNFASPNEIATLAGGTQTITGGPVASQEAIKELGTNGGGFYNANSSHPFENPNAWINLFEIFLLLVIPFSLPRMFGRMVGNTRQGVAVVTVMAVLWLGRRGDRDVGGAGRRRHGDRRGRGRDGGQGGPVRGSRLGAVRRVHHRDLHRLGEHDARLDDPGRRGRGPGQHHAGRGVARAGWAWACTGSSCWRSSRCSSPG